MERMETEMNKVKKFVAIIAILSAIFLCSCASDETLSSAEVGDTITFGTYEQDNDQSNGKEPIEWIVLEKSEKSILVISKYGLDYHEYTNVPPVTFAGNYVIIEEQSDLVQWQNSTMREWLNSDFMDEAFTSEDKSRLLATTFISEGNDEYSDKIFLLHDGEAEEFFPTNAERRCKATEYAKAQGVNTVQDYCMWWLSTPDYDVYRGMGYQYDGSIFYITSNIILGNPAVRPVIFISLES